MRNPSKGLTQKSLHWFLLLAWIYFFIASNLACGQEEIKGGHVITSTTYQKGIYTVRADQPDSIPFLLVQQDDITLDFSSATIEARRPDQMPDGFSGTGILIKDCKRVTLRNINMHGFKIALLAENVDHLTIENCDLSYNYRPRLHSQWDRESLSDWLYYHHNENDEWKRYGAAIYLKNCDNAIVHDVTCHQGMNGLLMTNSDHGLIYNNDIRFNSGLGIGLYRSSQNRIMHNRLDWNARGYSHGQYARGQDSAALLLYEQSSDNLISYNSATHSGDGFFLWAGQSTMDTGLGGCDRNILYNNDFSHSIANGIEATFSSTMLINNQLNDCHYGVWAGYSHHSLIIGNEIRDCETGVAIEQGRYINMTGNQIVNTGTGIKLWAREEQPDDWPYAHNNDVASRAYRITGNQFKEVKTAMDIGQTDSIEYHDNNFEKVQQEFAFPPDNSKLIEFQDDFAGTYPDSSLLKKMKAGQETGLAKGILQGRKYILINEWGPYDFQYPLLALRKKKEAGEVTWYYFDVYGPPGKWKIDAVKGFSQPENTSGHLPDSIMVFCPTDSVERYLGLSFTGSPVVTQLGDSIPANTPYAFHYEEFQLAMVWQVSLFSYDTLTDPLLHPNAFHALVNGLPLRTVESTKLAYRWWAEPFQDIPADRFAVKAATTVHTPAGQYILQTESDDGIRIWLDHQLILDHWDVHTPATDEVNLNLTEGQHEFLIEYFDAGGLAVLDVALSRSPN
jgi:parallel beta-helix repeat protein